MEIQRTSLETFGRYRARLLEAGQIRVRVETGSMEPLIPVGSEHRIVPIDGVPRPFDIIVFLDQGILLCHFVWSVNRRIQSDQGPWITTRCLASPAEDFPILPSQILGRLDGARVPTRTRLWIILKTMISSALRSQSRS